MKTFKVGDHVWYEEIVTGFTEAGVITEIDNNDTELPYYLETENGGVWAAEYELEFRNI